MIGIGVDRTGGRWVWVGVDAGGQVAGGVAETVSEITAWSGDALIGIDIPIGLPERSVGRRCDDLARSRLGERRSSVFPALPGLCYEMPYDERDAVIARLGLPRSYSKQAWGLGAAVLDVERNLTRCMFEVHPEVAFRARSSRDLPAKKTWNGMARRLAILRTEGVVPPTDDAIEGIPPDDVIDAAICAVVARDRAAGEERHLPPDREAGEPAIWF